MRACDDDEDVYVEMDPVFPIPDSNVGRKQVMCVILRQKAT